MRLNRKERLYVKLRGLFMEEVAPLDIEVYNYTFILEAIEKAGQKSGINPKRIARYDAEQLSKKKR